MVPYHLGVAFILKSRSSMFEDAQKIGASSGGALIALLSMIELQQWPSFCNLLFSELIVQRKSYFSPARINLQSYVTKFFDLLPPNIHQLANDRLFISTTKFPKFTNAIYSHFESREELKDVVLATCFLPYASGIMPPKIKGKKHIDGLFSKNFIEFDDCETVIITPHPCNNASIKPTQKLNPYFSIDIGNMNLPVEPSNMLQVLRCFTQPRLVDCRSYFEQGMVDTLTYLTENGHIEAQKPHSNQILETIYEIVENFATMDTKNCIEPTSIINTLQMFLGATAINNSKQSGESDNLKDKTKNNVNK